MVYYPKISVLVSDNFAFFLSKTWTHPPTHFQSYLRFLNSFNFAKALIRAFFDTSVSSPWTKAFLPGAVKTPSGQQCWCWGQQNESTHLVLGQSHWYFPNIDICIKVINRSCRGRITNHSNRSIPVAVGATCMSLLVGYTLKYIQFTNNY